MNANGRRRGRIGGHGPEDAKVLPYLTGGGCEAGARWVCVSLQWWGWVL